MLLGKLEAPGPWACFPGVSSWSECLLPVSGEGALEGDLLIVLFWGRERKGQE